MLYRAYKLALINHHLHAALKYHSKPEISAGREFGLELHSLFLKLVTSGFLCVLFVPT